MRASPLVTIGMPAFNSAATIRSSLESLLAQTFSDFELIVSDNASTDSTRDIVEELARLDPRIRYVRQAENIGANGNYSYVAQVARGAYFKWAASSDLCAPDFIEKCLAALENNGDAVLAAPRTSMFSGDISAAVLFEQDIEILDASPAARIGRLHTTLTYNNALNGLIRMEALRKTRLIEPYYQADVVLIGHLAMLGKIVRVNEYLYYRRMEVATATSLQDRTAWRRHHYPNLSARILFQAWKRYLGWMRACFASPMPFLEKIRVIIFVARLCYREKRLLWTDVCAAFSYFSRAGGRE